MQSVGLIRVFFGVENISKNFSIQNNKYVSGSDTINFINKLDSLNISYHIGFILLSRETKYEELQENIDFLHRIKKLFRPGMLVEKMRILPNSKDSIFLYNDDTKIDQAYNYLIEDKKVEKFYNVINSLFVNINIRNFEQFFSGIKIALTILKREKLIGNYLDLEEEFNHVLNIINDGIYEILSNEVKTLKLSNSDIDKLKELYSIAEVNYIKFMSYLRNNNQIIYETIPHGEEDLNVW